MKAGYFSHTKTFFSCKKTIGGFYYLGKLSTWSSKPKIAFAA